MPEMTEIQKERVRQAFHTALLPRAFHTQIRRILKETPEYRQALAEHRAKEWLERESDSLGYALAETVTARLETLEP